jgi:hypothetical protein
MTSDLSTSSQFQFTPDLNICLILNGMWRVFGVYGRIDPQPAITTIFHAWNAGLITWNLINHHLERKYHRDWEGEAL